MLSRPHSKRRFDDASPVAACRSDISQTYCSFVVVFLPSRAVTRGRAAAGWHDRFYDLGELRLDW